MAQSLALAVVTIPFPPASNVFGHSQRSDLIQGTNTFLQ